MGGFFVALSVTAVHLAPRWGVFSDAFPGGQVDAGHGQLTRALPMSLLDRGARANVVAGPVWTPLVSTGLSAERIESSVGICQRTWAA